jgi:hypothetical protein
LASVPLPTNALRALFLLLELKARKLVTCPRLAIMMVIQTGLMTASLQVVGSLFRKYGKATFRLPVMLLALAGLSAQIRQAMGSLYILINA